MTISLLEDGPGGPPTAPINMSDRPRRIEPGYTVSDHIFRNVARSIGIFVLILTGSIGLFLGYQAIPTLDRYGFAFFTTAEWSTQSTHIGILATLVGTIEVALVALAVAFPLAFLTALYISEYAPRPIKSLLVSVIDLMAAVPSIIFGLFGYFLLQPQAKLIARWLAQNLGWIPIFHVHSDPDAASWDQTQFVASAFIAGICVSMMVIPLACAIMRGVFAQAPIGEREAAYALGATRWGMIRSVVLPFGQGGIIGGTMLGLGRALGETVAVLLIISPSYEIKWNILEAGTQTTSALIANNFGSANSGQLRALLTAGFVLFVMTLGVNTIAAIFVGRSRSGAAVEI